MCQRQHGAAFSTYADFDPKHFSWTEGEPLVTVYRVPSGGEWYFCSKCGSTLAGGENGTIMNITLGTVQGDPAIRPDSHIFVGSKASWYEITDDLIQFQERAVDEEGQKNP